MSVVNLYLLNEKEKLARKKYKGKINLDWVLNCKRLCKAVYNVRMWKNEKILW